MARRRFFVDSIHNQQAEINGDDAAHLVQVLRVEAGQRYEISDNDEVWLAEVEMARKGRVLFRTLEKLPVSEPRVSVTVYAALIKFDHFELMIEKATELGVERVVPVDADRTEKGLERGAEKRLMRWRRIALESSQQSRRRRLPEISDWVRFADALKTDAPAKLFLDEESTGQHLLPVLRSRTEARRIALLIGPEGGWTDAERQQASAAQWISTSLGPQILRAETAAMAALAIINAVYETV